MNCVVYGCYSDAADGERVCSLHMEYLGITGRNTTLTTLRAENERLREVLRVIELTAGLVSDHSRVCADIVQLARAALGGG